ncbi:unnamed protein product, partial [Ectocarpus fasciculatus]
CLDPVDFGAVEGNPPDGRGEHWEGNTVAIQTAIDTAGSAYAVDGGRHCVVIRGGDYVTAAIEFRSHVTLVVEADSRLLTAANVTMPALLTGTGVDDIEITGGGVVYGNAEYYISYYDPVDDRYEPIAADGGRPRNLEFFSSTNIHVHNIRLENSSSWNAHFQGCANVTLHAVSIYGDWRFPNNDGIDPDSCINVTISNSNINTADDGVCPKSTEGFGPLRNLVVRNTTIRSKSHAIKFGSNTDTEMSDILFENITIWDSNAGLSIQQRSGGDIHNVTYRNINVETRYVAPRWWGNGEWLSVTAEKRHPDDAIGRTYDLVFENINAVTENGGLISGKLHGVQGLVMRNVNVELAQWSNYSTGAGPPCQHKTFEDTPDGANEMPCMGTQDHRPSYTEDHHCSYYCRTIAKADGLYLENVHHAVLDRVAVTF